MIGILNTGGEYSEFYATNPASSSHSLFSDSPQKPKVSYSKGGRLFINGEPQIKTNPKELWDSLLTRAISNSAIVSTLKAAGLEPRSQNLTTTNDAVDFRKVNSEASIPKLMNPSSNDTKKLLKPFKIFRRHRRSSSC